MLSWCTCLLCIPTGFCSVAEFAEGDLGTPLHADRTPPHIAALLKVSAKAMVPAVPKAALVATPVAKTPAPEVSHQHSYDLDNHTLP